MAHQSHHVPQGLELDRDSEGLQFRQYPSAQPEYSGLQTKEDSHHYNDKIPTDSGPQRHQRNPFGLRPLAFGILVAAITAVVVGAAVGGGVGGALGGSSKSGSSTSNSTTTVRTTTTTTATATIPASTGNSNSLADYTVPAPTEVVDIHWACPVSTLNTQDTTFNVTCGGDNGGGLPAVGGGVVLDLLSIVAYSVETCMGACLQWNSKYSASYPALCSGISFGRNLQYSYEYFGQYANCFLKNGTAVDIAAADNSLSADIVQS